MNIKRRIYDALNVLIALGLLKRSGNKILSKKCENDIIERDFEPESDSISFFIKWRKKGLKQLNYRLCDKNLV